MYPVFHVRFEPAIAEHGFAAVDSGWAKQEAGRKRKEDARERKGNKFWVRLRGEVRKEEWFDGGGGGAGAAARLRPPFGREG